METYYETLQVAESAPQVVITAAYRVLSSKYHPDRNPGDSAAAALMQKINVAYHTLSNPEARAQYDDDLRIARQQRSATEPSSESTRTQDAGSNVNDSQATTNPDRQKNILLVVLFLICLWLFGVPAALAGGLTIHFTRTKLNFGAALCTGAIAIFFAKIILGFLLPSAGFPSSSREIVDSVLESHGIKQAGTSPLTSNSYPSRLQQAKIQPAPELHAHVMDLSATLSAEARIAIENLINALKRDTGVQVVVLFVPTTGPEDIANFSSRMVESWSRARPDIAQGVLIAVARSDRQMRIQISNSLASIVTQNKAEKILSEIMAPAFDRGDFTGGVKRAIDELSILIRDTTLSTFTSTTYPSIKPDQIRIIELARPDFRDVLDSDGFARWHTTLSPQRQKQVSNATSAQEILKNITEYDMWVYEGANAVIKRMNESLQFSTTQRQRITPSFDCVKAKTYSERTICDSDVLSSADAEMSNLYHAALQSTADKNLLKQAQNSWRKNIRDACTSEECMISSYRTRIAQLYLLQ